MILFTTGLDILQEYIVVLHMLVLIIRQKLKQIHLVPYLSDFS